jgi:sRNA-binding regulator protein Hfq
MRKTIFQSLPFLLAALWLLALAEEAMAKPVTIVLKNGKVISGEIVEEAPGHVVLITDLGEVKVNRNNIERIIYEAFTRFKTDSVAQKNEADAMNDRVIVYLKNGKVLDGFLLAKSRSMVMVQTELGRLTISKNELRLIEYVSSAFAERGEPVVVYLDNGAKVEGYIYHEDRSSLTLDSNMGRLTVDKERLRSIEYKEIALPKRSEIKAPALVRSATAPFEASLQPRREVVELGYSSRFGGNYRPGFITAFRTHFLLKSFDTFSLNTEGNLGFAIYSLDQKAFTGANVPAAVTATGGAVITTLGAAAPVHFFPKVGSVYEFYVAPVIEAHIIHKRLKQSFPSFPVLDSEVVETNFRFGLSNRIGIEWNFGKWRAGLNYNLHFIFGEEDFNHISFHAATKLF